MPKISGSLVFRDTTKKMPKGKKLMLVFGVVAVDEDFSIPGDNMVRVKDGGDFMVEDLGGTKFMAMEEVGTPIGKRYAGWEIGDIFGESIWKA